MATSKGLALQSVFERHSAHVAAPHRSRRGAREGYFCSRSRCAALFCAVAAALCSLSFIAGPAARASSHLPLEQWANPSTQDPQHLDELLLQAKRLLARKTAPALATQLAADFVSFVDPLSPGRLVQVLFHDLDDPAAARLRYEVSLPAPPGYLFMRYYLTSAEMPPTIAQRFAHHDNAAAMTVMCRFVAIAQKLERPGSWAWSSPDRLRQAVSHEIVHAYLNSLLEPDALGRFPTWFHEGCAVYYGGNLGWDVSPTYREYLAIFQYIAAAKGEKGLARFVRTAVISRSLQSALRSIGEPSQETLLREAKQWRGQVRLRSQAAAAAALAAIVVGIILLTRRAARRGAEHDFEEVDSGQQ
jgi:hypothetical protein